MDMTVLHKCHEVYIRYLEVGGFDDKLHDVNFMVLNPRTGNLCFYFRAESNMQKQHKDTIPISLPTQDATDHKHDSNFTAV